jgi:anti-sigma factor RsiW
MLSDRTRQLLSAYLDGELSAHQQDAVEALLQRSPEARKLLAQLQGDAAQLRNLAQRTLGQDLADLVLAELAPLPAAAPRKPLAERTLPSWLGFPLAASVLLGVFWASYTHFARQHRPPTEVPRLATLQHQPPKEEIRAATPETVQPSRTEEPAPAAATVPTPAPLPRPTPPVERSEPLQKAPESVLATPTPRKQNFELVDPRSVLTSVVLRDLDQAAPQQKLRELLKAHEAHRLEIVGSANVRALDALVKALQAKGCEVHIEELAQQRSKIRQMLTDYAVVVEGLTAEELADVLTRLGKADRAADAKRTDSARFHDALVLPLTADDQKELAKLLGVEASPFEASPKGSAATKEPARQALLLAYNPSHPQPALSAEIHRYLDGRTKRKPGTLQILLVLRATPG